MPQGQDTFTGARGTRQRPGHLPAPDLAGGNSRDRMVTMRNKRLGSRMCLLMASLCTAALAACGAPGAPTPHQSVRAQAASATGEATPSAVASPAARKLSAGTTVPGAPECPMFPPNNVWNTDISRLPVNPHSAAWMRSMDSAHTYLHPDFGPNLGGYPYGLTFSIVTNAHPPIGLRFMYASESDRGPYPFGPDILIEGGKDAGGDRHAIMVNKSTCTLYELWLARYSARGSTAGSGAIWHLESNALRPAGWTSADAAGLPILPGLVNFSQVRAAARSGRPTTHAMRFTAEHTRSAFIWPARHQASSGSRPDLPPMGARFRLKAGFDVAGFCASSAPYCKDAKVVLVEMQHYGLILADNGTSWYFQGSAFPQWPDALVSLLKGIPASAFQAVDESCLMVRPDSGKAAGGPGCRIG